MHRCLRFTLGQDRISGMGFSPVRRLLLAVLPIALLNHAGAQQPRHGRGYKPPPPTATVVVTVEKGFNGKPMPNASVIFHAVRDEQTAGNLEMKTDPDGKASIDLLEVGSHVTVQVIANGFATYATDFDLMPDGKQLLVKLQRPRAQVSEYGDGSDRPAQVQPGIQEHRPDAGKPQGTPPSPQTQTAAPAPGNPGTPR